MITESVQQVVLPLHYNPKVREDETRSTDLSLCKNCYCEIKKNYTPT